MYNCPHTQSWLPNNVYYTWDRLHDMSQSNVSLSSIYTWIYMLHICNINMLFHLCFLVYWCYYTEWCLVIQISNTETIPGSRRATWYRKRNHQCFNRLFYSLRCVAFILCNSGHRRDIQIKLVLFNSMDSTYVFEFHAIGRIFFLICRTKPFEPNSAIIAWLWPIL